MFCLWFSTVGFEKIVCRQADSQQSTINLLLDLDGIGISSLHHTSSKAPSPSPLPSPPPPPSPSPSPPPKRFESLDAVRRCAKVSWSQLWRHLHLHQNQLGRWKGGPGAIHAEIGWRGLTDRDRPTGGQEGSRRHCDSGLKMVNGGKPLLAFKNNRFGSQSQNSIGHFWLKQTHLNPASY